MTNSAKYALASFCSLLLLPIAVVGQAVRANATDALVYTNRPTISPKQFRFYVGAHAAAQVFRVTSTTYPIEEAVIRPLYVFVGYQFSPRLAVQAGFLQHNPAALTSSVFVIDRAGQLIEARSYSDRYHGAVPVLLRYTVAQQLATRLRLEVLMGSILVFHEYQGDYVQLMGGQVLYEVHEYSKTRNLYVVGGLGLSYKVVSHVDLMLEGTANRNLTRLESAYARKTMFGIGAGLRYCFDFNRKVAAAAAP